MKKLLIKKKFRLFLTIYLMLFTSTFTMTTLSKYIYQITSTGSNNIAKWEVSLDTTGSNNNLDIVSGNNNETYTVKVISNSEVAVNYSFVLTGIPHGITVNVDGVEKSSVGSDRIIFENVGTINANDSPKYKIHSLIFSADPEINIPSINYIDLDVIFTQKSL